MSDPGGFLDSAEGEVSLFRSIMRTRPVGIHRHVHILAIHNSIYRDTGFKVPMQDIWAKLGEMYDLDVLEHGVSLSCFCSPQPCVGCSSQPCPMVVADTFVPPARPPASLYRPYVRPLDSYSRNSRAKILPLVPTPHLRTKTSPRTRASKKNSTHPPTTSPSNPTSPLDASDPPQRPQPQPRHPHRLQPAPEARQIPA